MCLVNQTVAENEGKRPACQTGAHGVEDTPRVHQCVQKRLELSADNLSVNAGGYFHHMQCSHIILCFMICAVHLHVHVTAHKDNFDQAFLEKENGIRLRKCNVRTVCTLWYDHAGYDYFPPCRLAQSKLPLTAVMARETRDVICM